MVNKDVLNVRLAKLNAYLSDLYEVRQKTKEEFLGDKIIRGYVERTLQLAIEICLDIAHHIISDNGWEEPESNRETFTILARHHVIHSDDIDELAKMAGFRNILVHNYIEIDPEKVYECLQYGLEDIAGFGKSIKEKYF